MDSYYIFNILVCFLLFPITLTADKTSGLPGLSRHILMNGDTVSPRSRPGKMADGIAVNPDVSLQSPFCGEHDIISAVILSVHQNSGVKLKPLFGVVSSACCVWVL